MSCGLPCGHQVTNNVCHERVIFLSDLAQRCVKLTHAIKNCPDVEYKITGCACSMACCETGEAACSDNLKHLPDQGLHLGEWSLHTVKGRHGSQTFSGPPI